MKQLIAIDEQIVEVLIRATKEGLMMAGLKPIPTGVSRFLQSRENISAIIGFVGSASGTMFINTSEPVTCFMCSRMLGETFTKLDNQVLDGLCEIANIIAGQTKAALSTTEHKFERISVPSVICGNSYSITHYRGMTSLSVEFELPEMPLNPGKPSTFTVNMSLMKI